MCVSFNSATSILYQKNCSFIIYRREAVRRYHHETGNEKLFFIGLMHETLFVNLHLFNDCDLHHIVLCRTT